MLTNYTFIAKAQDRIMIFRFLKKLTNAKTRGN